MAKNKKGNSNVVKSGGARKSHNNKGKNTKIKGITKMMRIRFGKLINMMISPLPAPPAIFVNKQKTDKPKTEKVKG